MHRNQTESFSTVHMVFATALVALGVGCTGTMSDVAGPPDAGADVGSDAITSPDSGPIAEAPTYYQDVEPILYTHCLDCHTDGGIAPWPLDTPEIVVSLAHLIASATSAREMPPWPPGERSVPMLHERTLSQEQIDTIAAWAAAGAPLGDPESPGPRVPPDAVDIGTPELSFDIGVDYEPNRELDDDYRCFLTDVGATETRTMTGYRVIPGNPRVVHHVSSALFRAEDRAALEALDAESPDRAGWPCFSGLLPNGVDVRPVGSVGSWVPGVSGVVYPEGTGGYVPAGSVAVIQVHYNLAGGTDPDRTRIEVALAPSGVRLMPRRGVRLAQRDLYIPAGAEDVAFETTLTVEQWLRARGGQPFEDGDSYVISASMHAHLLAKEMSISINGEPVLHIPAWDFHWQGGYDLLEPIRLLSGDEVTIRCVYDNSEASRDSQRLGPPVDVRWGEGTEDEMCLGGLTVVDELPPAAE